MKVPLLTPGLVCNTFPGLDVRTICQNMLDAGIGPSWRSKPLPMKSMVLLLVAVVDDEIVANGGVLAAVVLTTTDLVSLAVSSSVTVRVIV